MTGQGPAPHPAWGHLYSRAERRVLAFLLLYGPAASMIALEQARLLVTGDHQAVPSLVRLGLLSDRAIGGAVLLTRIGEQIARSFGNPERVVLERGQGEE